MSNKKIILPSTYFAPIPFYTILFKNSNCIIDIHENYVKQSVRNQEIGQNSITNYAL